jgi:hypothetical protein
MKRIVVFATILLMTALAGIAQTTEEKPAEPQKADVQAAPPVAVIHLGKIRFPQPFLQAGTEYPAGVYRVALAQRDGVYFFDVTNLKKEALFSEMAVIKDYVTRGRFAYRVRKELTSEKQFFRIKVIMPEKLVMAYFKVASPAPKVEPPAEKKPAEEKPAQEPPVS